MAMSSSIDFDHAMDGFTLIEDTDTHTAGVGDHATIKYWYNIECIVATEFTANCVVVSGGKPSTTQEYPAGFILRGLFTTIDLASGAVHAHNILTTS